MKGVHKMKSLEQSIRSSTIVSVVAIIAIAVCCLAALGFNSRISMEKGKIEVSTNSTSIK